MSIITEDNVCDNGFSDYRIGGNLCNAFAIGKVGSPTDFWMVGSPAQEVDDYPMITGNFLDSEGNHLFRLVRNVLAINPRGCSKILGNHIGYKIHDGQNNPILEVETKSYDVNGTSRLITDISGHFYDQNRSLVAWTPEDGGLRLERGVPHGLGLMENGRWFMSFSLEDPEMALSVASATSFGAIHRYVTGEHKGEKLVLDGALVEKVVLDGCELEIETGDFQYLSGTIINCTAIFKGRASRILWFANMMKGEGILPPPQK